MEFSEPKHRIVCGNRATKKAPVEVSGPWSEGPLEGAEHGGDSAGLQKGRKNIFSSLLPHPSPIFSSPLLFYSIFTLFHSFSFSFFLIFIFSHFHFFFLSLSLFPLPIPFHSCLFLSEYMGSRARKPGKWSFS
jgi:hypothetical protein